MANFLRLLGDSDKKPDKLILWNTGVRLVCEGSQVLEHMKKLGEQGRGNPCLHYLSEVL
jgi:hypothetical protein